MDANDPDVSPPAGASADDVAQQRALEHDAQHIGDELPEAPLPARGRRLRRWIKWGVALLVLGFVGRALWMHLAEATAQDVAFRWQWAILAAAALMVLYGSLMASERALLEAFSGVRLSWTRMMALAWVPLAGKYIPGKFAAVAGAVVLLKRAGVSTATGLSIFVILDAVPILTGSMLAGLVLLDVDVRKAITRAFPLAWALLPATILVGLVCIHPAVFGRLVNAALRLLRRPPLPRVPLLRDYISPALWSLGQWGGNASAVFLMCVALSPPGQAPSLAQFPTIVGITAIVMCASYFSAFLTPSGLGVREGLLLMLLSTQMPHPAAAAVTVAMRLAHTVVELVLCGVGLVMLRRFRVPVGTRVR